METPQNSVLGKDFQVTGVSRSGRVRKKSSKLLDFQSPDEVEKKLKRAAKPPTRNGNIRGRGNLSGGVGRPGRKPRLTSGSGLGGDISDLAEDDNDLHDDISDNETDGENFDDLNTPPGDSDEDIKELVAGIVDSEVTDNNGNPESKVRQSLYMTEKANKRRVLKDGRVVTGKLERKDKGKTRYTAYSMWAREMRKSGKFSKGQDLDFSNSAKRLGELWANVSNKEKDSWRRKAKIQATKAKSRERVTQTPANPYMTYFKPTTSRTKKLAEERQQSPQSPQSINTIISTKTKSRGNSMSEACESPTTGLMGKRRRNNSHNRLSGFSGNNISAHALSSSNITTSHNVTSATSHTSNSHNRKTIHPNIEPIDTAAHLKLLGESLTIIGERLKEHEGQIAVSGSLSVLLDSLLCSLGPLLCLTTRIPGLERKQQLSENLVATLDNIAYVMPGL